MAGWQADYERTLGEIRSGRVRPLYALVGEEGFPLAEILAALEAAVVSSAARAVDRVWLSAAGLSPVALEQEARTPSFFGTRRLVIVDAVPLFAGRGRDAAATALAHEAEADDAAAEAEGAGAAGWPGVLARLAADPPTDAVVALYAPVQVGRGRPLLKVVSQAGAVLETSRLREVEAVGWVRARARAVGPALTGNAAEELVAISGTDLRILAAELDKLATYASGGPVGPADVRLLAGPTAEARIFDLMDAMGSRRPGAAAAILADLIRQGDHPLRILATLAGHLQALAVVRALAGEGGTVESIAQELGWQPWRARRALGQARAFSDDELEEAIIAAADLDHDIKTGRIAPGLGLELFLFGLARG